MRTSIQLNSVAILPDGRICSINHGRFHFDPGELTGIDQRREISLKQMPLPRHGFRRIEVNFPEVAGAETIRVCTVDTEEFCPDVVVNS